MEKVIKKFYDRYVPLDKLEPSDTPIIVSGRVRSASIPFIAPISGKQCVYYNTVAEELVERTDVVRGAEGNEQTETSWV